MKITKQMLEQAEKINREQNYGLDMYELPILFNLRALARKSELINIADKKGVFDRELQWSKQHEYWQYKSLLDKLKSLGSTEFDRYY
ncbi:hypothetical protein COK52_16755 [Bacillus thuringiensis]|uniref:hypothetical protein n=1 Tax=Bacillus cereus TaxID=1396 RepID=UPI0009949483|nr:hypothetical protein [Bacillus cereus]OOZ87918.1 hypothetical protein BHL49_19395 [Bacillus cereus]PFT22408.1 hypothetical protein COK52_16755 [Bacillus thuringiensis]